MKKYLLSSFISHLRCLFVLQLVAFCGLTSNAQVLLPTQKTLRPNSEQQDEMRRWNSRLLDSAGVILNAPLGTDSNPEISKMSTLIQQVVYNLTGNKLKAANKQLVVHIYSTPILNAFVTKVDWNKKHLTTSILTEMYPTINLNKSVYELGITLGLLKKLKTVDELAFVIGHELSHLLEGHVDGFNLPVDEDGKVQIPHDPDIRQRLAKHWWSSQQHESVVDYLSIQMMVGKYNLEAALRALSLIFPAASKVDASIGDHILKNALSTHHAEGVRLSMAQVNIKSLYRSNDLAKPRDEISLADLRSVKYRAPRSKKVVTATREQTMVEAKTLWLKMLSQKIPILSSADEIVPEDLKEEQFPLKTEYDLDYLIEAISEVKQLIENSKFSIIEKGNAYWSLFQYYESNVVLNISMSKSVNRDQDVARARWIVTQALRKELLLPILNSIKGGWTAKDLFSYLRYGLHQRALNSGADALGEANLALYELFAISNHNDFMLWENIVGTPYGKNFLFDLYSQFIYCRGFFDMDAFLVLASRSEFDLIDGQRRQSRLQNAIEDYKNIIIQQDDFRLAFVDYLRKKPNELAALFSWLKIGRKKSVIRTDFFVWAYQTIREERRKDIYDVLAQVQNHKQLDPPRVNFIATTISEVPLSLVDSRLFSRALIDISNIFLNQEYIPGISFGIDQDKHYKRVASEGLSVQERVNMLTLLAITNDAPELKNLYYNADAAQQVQTALKGLSVDQFYKFLLQTPAGLVVAQQKLLSSEKYKATKAKLDEISKNNSPANLQPLKELLFANGKAWDAYYSLHMDLLNVANARINVIKGWLIYWQTIVHDPKILSQIPTEIVEKIIDKLLQEEKNRHQVTVAAEFGMEEVSYNKIYLSASAASGLLDLFSTVAPRYNNLKRWVQVLGEIYLKNPTVFDANPEIKTKLQQQFLNLAKSNQHYSYQLLKEKSLQVLLSADEILPILKNEFERRWKGINNLNQIAKIINEMDHENKLKETNPQIYNDFKEEVAILTQVQPHQLFKLFPENSLVINTQTTSSFGNHIRGLSAFSSLAQQASPKELIEMIEYLMSRSDQVPRFVARLEVESNQPFVDLLRGARISLSRQDQMTKTFTINTLLAGPNSALENVEGRNTFIDHLFKDVSDKNKSIAIELFESLLRSQGYFKSLSVSYILAQTAKNGKNLSEGEIIKAFFEAFGAAGIKLGQYLAFTGEFNEFQESLSKLQDSAMPLSYLQAVRLLQSRYGSTWDRQYKVIKIIGTGSVNVAIVVLNKNTKQEEVISVLRSDIETSSQDDFRMLKKFITDFIGRDIYHKNKYDYLLGLLDMIQDSVSLEFNKKNAFERQKSAVEIYNFNSGPWRFQSVQPYSLDSGAVRMEKAPGKTARHWRETNPKLYRDVMGRFLRWELDLLLGTHPGSSYVESMANPDVHDGQILIDSKDNSSGVVTVLDFGQALVITERERQLAFDILVMLEEKNEQAVAKQLINIQKNIQSGSKLSFEELQEFVSRSDRMDRFVYLLGVLKKHGWQVPMSSVHWIFGLNRADKLGKNIGININWALKTTLLGNKIGVPLNSVNRFRMSVSRLFGNENISLMTDSKTRYSYKHNVVCSGIYSSVFNR